MSTTYRQPQLRRRTRSIEVGDQVDILAHDERGVVTQICRDGSFCVSCKGRDRYCEAHEVLIVRRRCDR